jgi:hypothetical protein
MQITLNRLMLQVSLLPKLTPLLEVLKLLKVVDPVVDPADVS